MDFFKRVSANLAGGMRLFIAHIKSRFTKAAEFIQNRNKKR